MLAYKVYIKQIKDELTELNGEQDIDILYLILAKTYIDKKMFDEAKFILENFKKENFKEYDFLWSEFYLAQGDFGSAVDGILTIKNHIL